MAFVGKKENGNSGEKDKNEKKLKLEIAKLKEKYCVINGVIMYSKIGVIDSLEDLGKSDVAKLVSKAQRKIKEIQIGEVPDFSTTSLDSAETARVRVEIAKAFGCEIWEVALGLAECTKPVGEIKVIFIRNSNDRVTLAKTTQDPHIMSLLLNDEKVFVALALAENKYLNSELEEFKELKARLGKFIERIHNRVFLYDWLCDVQDSKINTDILIKIFEQILEHTTNEHTFINLFKEKGFNNAISTPDFLAELYTAKLPDNNESQLAFYSFFALHPNTPDDIYELAEAEHEKIYDKQQFHLPLNKTRAKAQDIQKAWQKNFSVYSEMPEIHPSFVVFFNFRNLSSETISKIWDYVWNHFLLGNPNLKSASKIDYTDHREQQLFVAIASHPNTPSDVLQKITELDALHTTYSDLSLRTALILNQNTNDLVVKSDELGPENEQNPNTFLDRKKKYVSEMLDAIPYEMPERFSTPELIEYESIIDFLQKIQINFDTASLIPLRQLRILLKKISTEDLAKNPRLALLGTSQSGVRYGYIDENGSIIDATNQADPDLKYGFLLEEIFKGELDERKILAMLDTHLKHLEVAVKLKDRYGADQMMTPELHEIQTGNFESYKILAGNSGITEDIFTKLLEILEKTESLKNSAQTEQAFEIKLALVENKKITKVKPESIAKFLDELFNLYCIGHQRMAPEKIANAISLSPFAATDLLRSLVNTFDTYHNKDDSQFYSKLLANIFAHPNAKPRYAQNFNGEGDFHLSFLSSATRIRQSFSISPSFNVAQINSFLSNLEVNLPTLVEILADKSKDGLLQNCPSGERDAVEKLILERFAGKISEDQKTKLSVYFPTEEALNEYIKNYYDSFWSEAKNTPDAVVKMILDTPELANDYVYNRYLQFIKWLDSPENKPFKNYFGENLKVDYKDQIMPIEHLLPAIFEFIQKVVLDVETEKNAMLTEQEQKLYETLIYLLDSVNPLKSIEFLLPPIFEFAKSLLLNIEINEDIILASDAQKKEKTLSNLLDYNNPNSFLGLVAEIKKYVSDNGNDFRGFLSKKPGKHQDNKTITLVNIIDAVSKLQFSLGDKNFQIEFQTNYTLDTFTKYLKPHLTSYSNQNHPFNYSWSDTPEGLEGADLALYVDINSSPEHIAEQLQDLKDYLEKVFIELKKLIKDTPKVQAGVEEVVNTSFDEATQALLDEEARKEVVLKAITDEVMNMNGIQEKLRKTEELKTEIEGRLESEEASKDFAHHEDVKKAQARIQQLKEMLAQINAKQEKLKQKIGKFRDLAQKEFESKLNTDAVVERVFDSAKKIIEVFESSLTSSLEGEDSPQTSVEEAEYLEKIKSLLFPVRINYDQIPSSGEVILNEKFINDLENQILGNIKNHKNQLKELHAQNRTNYRQELLQEYRSQLDILSKNSSNDFDNQKLILENALKFRYKAYISHLRDYFPLELEQFKISQEALRQEKINNAVEKQIFEAKKREAELLKVLEAQKDEIHEQFDRLDIQDVELSLPKKKLAIFILLNDALSFKSKRNDKLLQIVTTRSSLTENALPDSIFKELREIINYRIEISSDWNNLKKLYGGYILSSNQYSSLEAKLLNPELRFPEGLIYGNSDKTQNGALDYLNELKVRYELLRAKVELNTSDSLEELKGVLNLEIYKLDVFLKLFK